MRRPMTMNARTRAAHARRRARASDRTACRRPDVHAATRARRECLHLLQFRRDLPGAGVRQHMTPTSEQQRVIDASLDGPHLVDAGAGTGKTFLPWRSELRPWSHRERSSRSNCWS